MALNANFTITESNPALLREGIDELPGQPPGHKSPFGCFGLEFLAMIANLGFAVFLTVGFAAGSGLTSGMSLTNPIAVRLGAGFFVWSLALISSVTSRRA
jgi:hypothetical protein